MQTSKSTVFKRTAILIGSLVILIILLFALIIGYLIAGQYLTERPIQAVYNTVNIGDSKQDVNNIIDNAMAESGILSKGSLAGLHFMRDPVEGAESHIFVSTAQGEFICQGMIYFDENQEAIHFGEVFCID